VTDPEDIARLAASTAAATSRVPDRRPVRLPRQRHHGPVCRQRFLPHPKGGTHQFLVNVAFTASKTFINGRGYRLRMPTTAGVQFKVGFNGPLFAGPTYGVPATRATPAPG